MLTPIEPPSHDDPDEILAGRCGTCGHVTEIKRSLAEPAEPKRPDKDVDPFADGPYCECQVCKEASKLRVKVGPRVYLSPKKKK